MDAEEERKLRSFVDNSLNKSKLITKYLSIEVVKRACELKAKPLIMECIEASALSCSPSIGILAANLECYNTLAMIFEPLIEDIHSVANDVKQPSCFWGDWKAFERLDDEFVQSIRISCRRSIVNFSFAIEMNEQDFENVLNDAQNAIQRVFVDEMNGLEGEFYKIIDVNENEPIFDDLKRNRIGFAAIDEKMHCHWPVGRGLFVNGNRTLSILINESDHLHFVSCQNSGDFGIIEMFKFFLNFLNKKMIENFHFQKQLMRILLPLFVRSAMKSISYVTINLVGSQCVQVISEQRFDVKSN